MSKELKSGVEHHDGREVESYTGRFSGGFDVDYDKGVLMASDDLYAFVVTARVGDAKFTTGKATGILSRANTFAVQDVSVIDLDKAKWLYDQLGKSISGVTELIESQTPVVDENQMSVFDVIEPVHTDSPFLPVHFTNGAI